MNNKKLISRYQKGQTISKYVNDKYGNFEFIEPELPQVIKGRRPFKGTLHEFLAGYNSDYYPLEDYDKERIDTDFNNAYDAGAIKLNSTPDVVVQGIPHILLYTYPPSMDKYIPGHSMLYYPGLYVDRRENSKNYNLLFNNCSDSTNCALKDILGDAYQWIDDKIVTPNKVHEELLKVKNAKDEVYDDVTVTKVPVYNRPKTLKSQYYYENGTSKQLQRK